VSSPPLTRAGRVRVSAGVADLQPNDGPNTLFERADEALYEAKHNGKNEGQGGLAAAD
jgi:PleD family two-component response regulator